jgi:hypothetical protein
MNRLEILSRIVQMVVVFPILFFAMSKLHEHPVLASAGIFACLFVPDLLRHKIITRMGKQTKTHKSS